MWQIVWGLGQDAYQKHILKSHPKMPCYPGLGDIEKYALKPQGMEWKVEW